MSLIDEPLKKKKEQREYINDVEHLLDQRGLMKHRFIVLRLCNII